ncbi:MAG: NUDIX domain-containing protein [Planctomycetes bacterium]|nr:NUDIX domain-containing protein [Planctomycetota bacterium]
MTRVSHDMMCVYVFRHREHGPEFLLLRRAAGDYMGGTWQPVYGGIREGETAWQAALREMREETGLVPSRLYQANSVDSFYTAGNDTVYHCPVFAAEVPGDAEVALNAEHDEFDWVHVDDVAAQLIWPGQRRAVAEIVQEIIRGGPAQQFLEIRV